MTKKKSTLIITGILLVAIVLLLIFSPILKSKPDKIEPGVTYQGTITAKDPIDSFDKYYRRHTYSLTVAVDTTYEFEVSSLSDNSIILVFEYYEGKRIHILSAPANHSRTTDHHFVSAGLKIIWVEALYNECPADYSLRVTLIEGEDS
ncbi:MAG TPA: hypothetical protein G4O16_01175 [Dehalococcoidia bacterium]|nr:hypothetical protein [Dehalococcoidia bacterium]